MGAPTAIILAMRYLTAALARHTSTHSHAKADRTDLALMADQDLPPLTRHWPRMNEHGLEWTEPVGLVVAEARRSARRT